MVSFITTVIIGYLVLACVCTVWLYINRDNEKLSAFFSTVQNQFDQTSAEKDIELYSCKGGMSIFLMSIFLWWYMPVMIHKASKQHEEVEELFDDE